MKPLNNIIKFEEIIEKKFLLIELSKNRVESCRFLLKAVVTCMDTTTFYEILQQTGANEVFDKLQLFMRKYSVWNTFVDCCKFS